MRGFNPKARTVEIPWHRKAAEKRVCRCPEFPAVSIAFTHFMGFEGFDDRVDEPQMGLIQYHIVFCHSSLNSRMPCNTRTSSMPSSITR